MRRIIKTFQDGSTLDYDEGTFDEWCVYLTRPGIKRHAPKDKQYFERLVEYGAKYGNSQVYDDFVQIYNVTEKKFNESVFDLIDRLSEKYGNEAVNVAIDFSIIYMGMISEENKRNTKLGKRVKRLGVHQLLVEKFSYNEAADFSRGKKWTDIDIECKKRGF